MIILLASQPASPQAAAGTPQQLPPATQGSPAQPPPVVQALPDQDSPGPSRPGLVDEIGKFFTHPSLSLPSIKSPQQTIEDLNSRARDAGDNLSRLSKGQVVAGRVKCPTAANGAPDCKSAATKLCTDKGFKEGQSVDSDSAEDCPASVLLSGKPQPEQECRVANYVIRALCQ